MRSFPRKTSAVLVSCLGLALAVPSAAAATWPALLAGGATTLAAAHAPATTDRLLRQGERGEDVRQWQEVLDRAVAAGLLDHPRVATDGVFGPRTRSATVALQARLGITQDGVVGPVTREGVAGLLDGSGAAPDPGLGDAEQGEDRLLRAGARGEDVRAWQRVLNRAVSTGRVEHPRIAEDGLFGPRTGSATVELQRRLGVPADGIVGPVTRDGVAGLLDA